MSKKNLKGVAGGLALLALAVPVAKGAPSPSMATMVANHSVVYEDGSGRYAQTFRYTNSVSARYVFSTEFGERPTRLVCRPTVCVARYEPNKLDGSAMIRISTRKAGRYTIATARGTYCLGTGYLCAN
jgi:hypothetical protein